jgi:hypothetical protein
MSDRPHLSPALAGATVVDTASKGQGCADREECGRRQRQCSLDDFVCRVRVLLLGGVAAAVGGSRAVERRLREAELVVR